MDATKWTQGFQEMMGAKPMEQTASTPPPSSTTSTNNNVNLEKKTRPQEKLNCPRCNSTNTKFCYYNNYSLTQPRYFCKACRRYWTEGGTLRNVPVGGSSRKYKRSSSSSSSIITPPSSSSSAAAINVSSLGLTNKLPDLNPPVGVTQKGSQDLYFFSFPVMQDGQNSFSHQFLNHQMPKIEINQPNIMRNGADSRGLDHNSMASGGQMLDPNTFYSSGFPILMQDYKQSNDLSFSSDVIGNYSNRSALLTNNAVQENADHVNGSRVLFPYGEMKEYSNTEQDQAGNQQQQQQKNSQGNSNTEYWSGMFRAGGPPW